MLFTENGRGLKNISGLTEEQITVVREAITGSTEKAAENLVASGMLTQEEADSITSRKGMKGEKSDEDKTQIKSKGYLADLTDEQVQSLKDEFSTIFKEALAVLVADGSITQEIADQVQNMPKGMGHGGRGRK